jgi:hypothetical protein
MVKQVLNNKEVSAILQEVALFLDLRIDWTLIGDYANILKRKGSKLPLTLMPTTKRY